VFLFAHVGLTLGAAVVITGLIETGRGVLSRRRLAPQSAAASNKMAGDTVNRFPLTSWVERLGEFLDLRFLVLGSLLPDIIDKPLGAFLFGDGRIFTHSLMATLLVLVTGYFLYINYKRTAVLAVACGMAAHLVLDSMWASPPVFLWPLYGWGFPAGTRGSYLHVWVTTLTTNPSVYLTEGAGLAIIGIVLGILGSTRKLFPVLKKGRL
jgi:inner membrane protein